MVGALTGQHVWLCVKHGLGMGLVHGLVKESRALLRAGFGAQCRAWLDDALLRALLNVCCNGQVT